METPPKISRSITVVCFAESGVTALEEGSGHPSITKFISAEMM